jgi:hypothetical protein
MWRITRTTVQQFDLQAVLLMCAMNGHARSMHSIRTIRSSRTVKELRMWDILATWREKSAAPVTENLDCGRFLPEERARDVVKELLQFF